VVTAVARSLRHVTEEEKKNPPDCKSLGRTLQFLIKPTQMCTCFVYRSLYRFLLNKMQVHHPLHNIISFVDLRSRVGDDEVVVQPVDRN
jgi:hypothetical protein